MPKIIIVDESDKIIGYKERGTLKQDDIYRVSALWIKNSKGDVLLAQRSFDKRNDPGKWGPAVAGTNDEGETYESNIIKEAKEEIGLSGFRFKKLTKIRNIAPWRNYFCQWFTLEIDKPISFFKIQEDEVEQLKWFSKEELLKKMKDNPDIFLQPIKECLENF